MGFPDGLLNKFEFYLQNELFNYTFYLNGTEIQNVFLNESLDGVSNSLYTQWFLMPLDIIDSNMLKPPPPVKKNTPTKNISKISFNYKTIQ